MRKLILAISALALVTSAAFADPIADRQALMKANGKAMGALVPMTKGEKPFDAAVVLDGAEDLNDNAQKMDVAGLFPAGSDTSGDTTASPKIWEDMAGFQAKVDKFKADTAAALAAPPQDVEALEARSRNARPELRRLPRDLPHQEGLTAGPLAKADRFRAGAWRHRRGGVLAFDGAQTARGRNSCTARRGRRDARRADILGGRLHVLPRTPEVRRRRAARACRRAPAEDAVRYLRAAQHFFRSARTASATGRSRISPTR